MVFAEFVVIGLLVVGIAAIYAVVAFLMKRNSEHNSRR